MKTPEHIQTLLCSDILVPLRASLCLSYMPWHSSCVLDMFVIVISYAFLCSVTCSHLFVQFPTTCYVLLWFSNTTVWNLVQYLSSARFEMLKEFEGRFHGQFEAFWILVMLPLSPRPKNTDNQTNTTENILQYMLQTCYERNIPLDLLESYFSWYVPAYYLPWIETTPGNCFNHDINQHHEVIAVPEY